MRNFVDRHPVWSLVILIGVALLLWLIVAPWVLGYGQITVVAWSHLAIGVLIILAAAWELWDETRRGNKAAT